MEPLDRKSPIDSVVTHRGKAKPASKLLKVRSFAYFLLMILHAAYRPARPSDLVPPRRGREPRAYGPNPGMQSAHHAGIRL